MITQIKTILKYKELLLNLVIKDLKVRYKGAVLGYMWSMLSPIFMMIIYTVVFSYIIRIEVENYPFFLLCAFLPWSFFSVSLTGASNSIVDNFNLINKVYFPREIFPLSVVFSNLIHVIISITLLVVFLLFTQINLGLQIFLLPFVIFVHVIFTTGIALILSCLTVFYRDIKHILDSVVMVWFFATPILYPVSMVPEGVANFYNLNPMVGIISIYRSILFYGKPPGVFLCLTSFAISLLTLFVGHYIFKKYDPFIVKTL